MDIFCDAGSLYIPALWGCALISAIDSDAVHNANPSAWEGFARYWLGYR